MSTSNLTSSGGNYTSCECAILIVEKVTNLVDGTDPFVRS
jgi:hypothetical protein